MGLTKPAALREGQVLTGPLFSEPMLVETVRANGPGAWVAGLVGRQSERFRRVTLTAADLAGLTVANPALTYDGDGRALRLAMQEPVRNPARFPWREVVQVQHYRLDVDALKQPLELRERATICYGV